VRTVAVYSDADAKALHVPQAQTHDVLGLAFAAALNAPIAERAQFGVFRM
jgi:acetyl/propionyl-CoA carboxylase alpha subunit